MGRVRLLGRQRRRLRARLASARADASSNASAPAVARASARGAQTFRARTTSRPDPNRAPRGGPRRGDRDRAPRSEVLASRFAPRGTRASREHSDAARVNAVERRFGSARKAASDASLIDPRLLGDADPYVVTRWLEQRFINLDRGSKLPLGSLAPACDPSGSEGVGTGEFADRTAVAYRSRLRLKVVVPSGSSRREGSWGMMGSNRVRRETEQRKEPAAISQGIGCVSAAVESP